MKGEALALSIGKILQVFISLVSIRLLTGLLSEDEIGFYYLFLSIMSYMGLVFINPVGMYVNRKTNDWWNQKKILNYLFLYNIYITIVTLISSLFIWLAWTFLGIGNHIEVWIFVVLTVLYTFINTWNQTILPILNMLFYRISYVVFTVLSLAFGVLSSYVLVNSFDATAIYWIIGTLLSQFVVTFIALFYLRSRLAESFDFKQVQYALKYNNEIKNIFLFCIPIAISTFFMWIQDQSYRIFVENSIGLAYLAMIAVGFNLSKSIYGSVESLIHQVFFPIYYKEIDNQDIINRSQAWRKMASIVIPIYILLLVFVITMAPYLSAILLDQKFHSVYYFIVFGAVIEFFRVVTNILSSVAHSEYSTKSLMKPYIYGGIVATVGIYIATQYKILIDGIPLVLLISGFVTMVCMYLKMKKLLPLSINSRVVKFSIIISSPLLLAVLFYDFSSRFISSLMILGGFGSYFGLAVFFLFNKYYKKISLKRRYEKS